MEPTSEMVTGRKARGLQREEIGYKCQTCFISLLSGRRKQTTSVRFLAMAPQSSTLAWKIPWMEEPGGLQSMGSLRVGHDWTTSFSLFTFMCWRKKWQPTPVFLPGKSHGWSSLVGYSPWGHKELNMTEQLHFHLKQQEEVNKC